MAIGSKENWRRLAVVLPAAAALVFVLPNPGVNSDVGGFGGSFDTAAPPPASPAADVWLVESADSYELYSNGLRVENEFTVPNEQRFFQLLDRQANMEPMPEWRSEPVGIVYHTTESPQARFAPEANHALRRLGRSLLKHVQDRRSYHFLIDRFGRVFRIVPEGDVANHAGNSVWAAGRWAYINLNASFIGIAFEAATDLSPGEPVVNAAQAHAGRGLTEVLRKRYDIPPNLCVTHAQVSVNPSNMRIGYHTDGAARFPWAALGLPDNYNLVPASLSDFGFTYDEVFETAMGASTWPGLSEAQGTLDRDASRRKVSPGEHRQWLKDRYRRLYSALRETGALDAEDGG